LLEQYIDGNYLYLLINYDRWFVQGDSKSVSGCCGGRRSGGRENAIFGGRSLSNTVVTPSEMRDRRFLHRTALSWQQGPPKKPFYHSFVPEGRASALVHLRVCLVVRCHSLHGELKFGIARAKAVVGVRNGQTVSASMREGLKKQALQLRRPRQLRPVGNVAERRMNGR
jgi:hypothetical protein